MQTKLFHLSENFKLQFNFKYKYYFSYLCVSNLFGFQWKSFSWLSWMRLWSLYYNATIKKRLKQNKSLAHFKPIIIWFRRERKLEQVSKYLLLGLVRKHLAACFPNNGDEADKYCECRKKQCFSFSLDLLLHLSTIQKMLHFTVVSL